MRIMIIGSSGQLGVALQDRFCEDTLILPSHSDMPIEDENKCKEVVESTNPDYIINCAVFYTPESCNDNPEQSKLVNHNGPTKLAWSSQFSKNIKGFLQISTDMVFNGEGGPYVETDKYSPDTIYGQDKANAEVGLSQLPATIDALPPIYIIRISSLWSDFGSRSKNGKNFYLTMLENAFRRERVAVVDNVLMSPTYAPHAAGLIKAMIEEEVPCGIYHGCNDGGCSWYDFAEALFKGLGYGVNLLGRKQAETSKNTILSIDKIKSLGIEMPSWEESIALHFGGC
jgi:dTDP-4-dehydrorhamnose reductase